MYKKKCPTCEKEISYKSKDSLSRSIIKNSNCRECMGKVISEKRKGMKFTIEHKKKLSDIKKCSKLSEEHKRNIGLSLKGMKRTEESKKRYSESKMGDKNPNFMSLDRFEEKEKYYFIVERLTRKNKKDLLKTWNGLDYYDNELIISNFNLHYNNKKYPTIDHKIPISYGFKHGFSPEIIGSIENLCFTKRELNGEKYMSIEKDFIDKLKQ
jgi:hypothetical protein